MQAEAPGGHASGVDVSLDTDDIDMQDYVREALESAWEDDDRVSVDGNDELREEVDGYLMLCDAQMRR